ncbi:MAG: RibD family protein [Saprospiraceae bacterium]
MKSYNNIWDQILTFKEAISKSICNTFTYYYSSTKGFSNFVSEDSCMIFTNTNINIDQSWKVEKLLFEEIKVGYLPEIDTKRLEMIKLYIPLVLMRLLSTQERPRIIVHMAQTIDGKICTHMGNSKWIGNQENLIHAHRIRALVDGVLVGGNTIAADLPKLNVRLVKGKNPIRVLLSNTFSEFHKLPIIKNTKTIILRNAQHPIQQKLHASMISINYAGKNEFEKTISLLNELSKQGIKTLLIEGGSKTVSSFVKIKTVDILQVHIAPIVFGGGKSSFNLPSVDKVNDSLKLKNIIYSKIGNAIMVTGKI